MIVKEMSRQECVALLSNSRLARLACARDNQPYVIPIHYAYADNYLYSYSMVGQKLEWMRANPLVCVQLDHFLQPRIWQSVIVFGRYEELPDTPEWSRSRQLAWSLLQKHANWWEPGCLKTETQCATGKPTHVFYRVEIEHLTGRQSFPD
jgi:nitroimidazol reductase NimA-like FMN-containing flavoprotein (pyridoxamine 5'-phosphate oxidase superfamily)